MNNKGFSIIIASIVTVGFTVLPAMAATTSSTTPTQTSTVLTTTTTTATPNDWYYPGWD